MSTKNYQAIALDETSPWGYKVEHAAFHGAGHYDDAIQSIEMMLSKMALLELLVPTRCGGNSKGMNQ